MNLHQQNTVIRCFFLTKLSKQSSSSNQLNQVGSIPSSAVRLCSLSAVIRHRDASSDIVQVMKSVSNLNRNDVNGQLYVGPVIAVCIECIVYAIKPPSTGSATPVMRLADVLARNATASAISAL